MGQAITGPDPYAAAGERRKSPEVAIVPHQTVALIVCKPGRAIPDVDSLVCSGPEPATAIHTDEVSHLAAKAGFAPIMVDLQIFGSLGDPGKAAREPVA